jgi:hypothetical protein
VLLENTYHSRKPISKELSLNITSFIALFILYKMKDKHFNIYIFYNQTFHEYKYYIQNKKSPNKILFFKIAIKFCIENISIKYMVKI